MDDFEQFVAEFVDGFGGSCGAVGVRVWTVVLEVEPFVPCDLAVYASVAFEVVLGRPRHLMKNGLPAEPLEVAYQE